MTPHRVVWVQPVLGQDDAIVGCVSAGGSGGILGSQDLAFDTLASLLHRGAAYSHICVCDDELRSVRYYTNRP